MAPNVAEIGGLIVLLIAFLLVPQITAMLKSSLDTLPVRLLAIIAILASVSYDTFLALGVFLVVSAIYIQHHHEDVLGVVGTNNNLSAYSSANDSQKYNATMGKLEHGGVSDEIYDNADFTSKAEDQDNEFNPVDSSMNEKHALISEQLGSRAQNLFPDDSRHVNAMEHGNKNGYTD